MKANMNSHDWYCGAHGVFGWKGEACPQCPTADKPSLRAQVGGDHYTKLGKYQPWEVLAKWLTPEELKGFMTGTVIAYLAREADKGEREDIEKASHTLQLYLELTKNA